MCRSLVGPCPTVLLAAGGAGPAPRGRLRVVPVAEPAVLAALGLAAPGAGYLVRPDGHVAWRWQRFDPAGFATALARLMGR